MRTSQQLALSATTRCVACVHAAGAESGVQDVMEQGPMTFRGSESVTRPRRRTAVPGETEV